MAGSLKHSNDGGRNPSTKRPRMSTNSDISESAKESNRSSQALHVKAIWDEKIRDLVLQHRVWHLSQANLIEMHCYCNLLVAYGTISLIFED
ncbi:hypothetical protein C2S51_037574 [Perilla frutescens var. frutescens]|nr:hypothetical protein C2S51_037574 [Perilla frutescens var. frutescens]